MLVGFSGGPDSVALLHILRALERRGELRIAGLAHLNHQLRHDESEQDEQFCRDLAGALALPLELGRADVAAEARAAGRSLEDAGRRARYRFLHRAAERLQAEVIAVGHSQDDQAETYLLRLLRGAGARGLAGIRPRTGIVVRPLLDISRAELRQYAAEHQLAFREDASNHDTRIPRNRIRRELLPYLERFTPAIVPLLARQAALAREDEAYLSSLAIDLAGPLVLRTDQNVQLDARGMQALPTALASRVARLALEAAAPGRFVARDHIDGVIGLCHGREGASVALPGQVARRLGAFVILGAAPEAAFSNSFRFPLSIPGDVQVPGWALAAEPAGVAAEVRLPPARGSVAVVAAGPLHVPLAVRTRRPGDRFRPLGMGGHERKLQDLLVDRKIARADRDRLPLVVDRDDRIVWVVGQSIAEDFRVTAPEQPVILLKARRLGGPG